jgi:hypothetical protein
MSAMNNVLFKKLNMKETTEILDIVNKQSDLSDFVPERTIIMAQGLVFYPGYKLYEVSDQTQKPEKKLITIINDNKACTVVDYTYNTIYALNASAPINLDTGVLADYVRFFFGYVRGKHGRFVLVESLDDIPWQEEPPMTARKAISQMIEPLTILDRHPDSYVMEARFIFRDSLIKALLEIGSDGIIKMKDEEILIEDMPIIDQDLNA